MGNYTNLNNLGNITPLNINVSGLNNSQQIIQTTFGITHNLVGDLWFTAGTFAIFMVLTFTFYRKDGNFLYDIMRSMFISSSFTFFLALSITLSGLTYTVMPLIWYGTLWFVLGITVYSLKLKNQ